MARREGPLPTLDQMRGRLRAGMTKDEFYGVLDDLAETQGLRVRAHAADVVGLPVAEGGELLCFVVGGSLTYVEYQGGIFLEVEG